MHRLDQNSCRRGIVTPAAAKAVSCVPTLPAAGHVAGRSAFSSFPDSHTRTRVGGPERTVPTVPVVHSTHSCTPPNDGCQETTFSPLLARLLGSATQRNALGSAVHVAGL
jgi:hypothetical protein